MPIVEEYLQAKGWSYKPCGLDNYSVETCPICGDGGWHFGIHKELGLWRCLKPECDAAGNLYTLKRHLGDIVEAQQATVQPDASAIPMTTVDNYCSSMGMVSLGQEYLIARGLTPAAITHFKIGLAYDATGVYWLTIPYLQGDTCTDIKFKSIPPAKKMFKKVTGAQPCLYNQDDISDKDDVIITEGELDCIALWQLGYGNAISVPFGYASKFKPEHWDTLANKKKIYLLFDSDIVGRKGAKKLAERLDPARCYEVSLPGVKDANEFICSGGDREQLDYILAEAKPYGKPQTYTAVQALNELAEQITNTGQIVDGPVYPWDNMTNLFGPMAPEEMTTILGPAGVGKTSLALQILTHAAKQCQAPSLLLCLEMPVHRITQLLTSQVTLCDRNAVKHEHTIEATASLYGAPLYISRKPAMMTWENIRELLLGSIRRFGIKVWCLDNIQYLCRSENMVQAVGIACKQIKELAEETHTHALIISHPRKMQEGNVPTMYDAAWSQAISADSDGMISVYRKPLMASVKVATQDGFQGSSGSYDDKVLISAAKTRYGGGGATVLWLDGPSGRFLRECRKPKPR